MQIVIDTKQCPCRTLNDECGISGHECYEDDICSTCPLIRNGGTKLPKGHGNLIDADALLEKQYRIDDSATLSTRDVVNVEDVEDAPTIIEADKEET